jgi:hypothetical protein
MFMFSIPRPSINTQIQITVNTTVSTEGLQQYNQAVLTGLSPALRFSFPRNNVFN